LKLSVNTTVHTLCDVLTSSMVVPVPVLVSLPGDKKLYRVKPGALCSFPWVCQSQSGLTDQQMELNCYTWKPNWEGKQERLRSTRCATPKYIAIWENSRSRNIILTFPFPFYPEAGYFLLWRERCPVLYPEGRNVTQGH
jgi:hypothetical protein